MKADEPAPGRHAPDETGARPRGPLGPLLHRFGITRLALTEAQRQAIEDSLYRTARVGGPATRNFVVLSILSSTIAALGLLLDSAPAVIGAMLLGPFIVPLLATAGALVQGRPMVVGRALTTTLVGIGLSVGAAFVVGSIVGSNLDTAELPSQLRALTQPGLLDLAIAFAAGIAAGYATMRTDAGGALSGVAVSVTIEPPLAAIGLFLAAGNDFAVQRAALAMVTNFGALVVGATFALSWWGFAGHSRAATKAGARLGVALWLALVALVAVPLSIYSRQVVNDQRFEAEVSEAIATWDPSVRVTALDARIRSGDATIVVDLTGPRPPEAAWRLAELVSDRRGVKVRVRISFVLATEDEAVATP